MDKGVVLVADDDASIRTVLNQALTRAGFEVRVTSNASTLWRWVSEGEGDVVISDVIMPDGDVFELLPKFRLARPDLPLIVISAQNTFMTAIKASESGAYEYLPKPFDLDELISVTTRAMQEPGGTRNTQKIDDYLESMPLVGRSTPMQEIYRAIARITQSALPVMLTGENGTGKHLVARILHQFGARKHNPFVAVNISTLSAEQLETELFGDQSQATTGKLRQADGGTLFLREIGEMPLEIQSRMLAVLQGGELMHGERQAPQKIDVRIIVATSHDMDQLISQGSFREDLYYRLNVVPLRLPPLRERYRDIPDLARHFIKLCELEGAPTRHIDAEALKALKQYSWPGNVRELENFMQRIVMLYPQETITGTIVETELINNGLFRRGSGLGHSQDFGDLSDATEFFVNRYFSDYQTEHGNQLPPDGLYHVFLDKFEKPVITAALAATNGNQIKAAELLGLNRNTLRKKIRQHAIKIVRTSQ